MLNNSRIFRFDENSLNSSSTSDTTSTTSTNEFPNPFGTSSTSTNSTLFTNPTNKSTTTISDSSLQSPETEQGSTAGIYEDHPGLHPDTSERIVELQSDIHQRFAELMPDRTPQEVLVMAEVAHAESRDIPFLESMLDDLNTNGTGSQTFRDAMEQAAELIPSPLEQFSILPFIPMNIGNLYFSFTNPSLFMLLTLSLVLLLVHFVTKKGGGNSVPNAWQSLVELIHDFVLNPVNEQIGGLSGNVKQKFSPTILALLLFCYFVISRV
ncbi:hypothetical protein Droror1_Dr00028064 [Drosera rotundifolia]